MTEMMVAEGSADAAGMTEMMAMVVVEERVVLEDPEVQEGREEREVS